MPDDHIRLTADASSLVQAYQQASTALKNYEGILSVNVGKLQQASKDSEALSQKFKIMTADNREISGSMQVVNGQMETFVTNVKDLNPVLEKKKKLLKQAKKALQAVATEHNEAASAAKNHADAQKLLTGGQTGTGGSKKSSGPLGKVAGLGSMPSADIRIAEEARANSVIVQGRLELANAMNRRSELDRQESKQTAAVRIASEKAADDRIVAARLKLANDINAHNAQARANNKAEGKARARVEKEETEKRIIREREAAAEIKATFNSLGAQLRAADKKRTADAKAESQKLADAKVSRQKRIAASQRRIIEHQRRITSETKKSATAAKGMLISWRSMGRLVGVQLIHRSIAALSNAMRDAISISVEFQQSVAEIQTIDTSSLPFDQWSADLRRLSDSWGFDLMDQAEAAYQALSNQVVEGADAFEFLNEANILAKASITSTTDSVNILSSVLNSYNLDASRSAEISDILFKTVELGRVRIDEMATTIGRLTVPASQLGISFEELAAGITVITNQGVKYSEATTFLRNVLQKLLKPSEDMAKVLERNGFQSGQAALATLGFGGTLGLLQKEAGGSSVELAEMFDRIRAIAGAFSLTGKNLDKFNANLQELENASGSAAKAAALVQDNVGRKLIIELNRTKNVFLKDFGEPILKSLNTANDAIGGLNKNIRIMARAFSIAGDAISVFTDPLVDAAKSVQNVDIYRKLEAGTEGVITGWRNIAEAMVDARDRTIEISEALNKVRLDGLKVSLREIQKESRKTLRQIAQDAKKLNEAIGKDTEALDTLIAELKISARETADSMNDAGSASKQAGGDAEKAWKSALEALNGFDKAASKNQIKDLFKGISGTDGGKATEQFDRASRALGDLFRKREELAASVQDKDGFSEAEQAELDKVNGQIDQLIAIREDAMSKGRKLNEQRVDDERKTAEKIQGIRRKSEEKIADLEISLTEARNNKDVDAIISTLSKIKNAKTKARRDEDKANLELIKRNADRELGKRVIPPEAKTANIMERQRDVLKEIVSLRAKEVAFARQKNKDQEVSFEKAKKELADIETRLGVQTAAKVIGAVSGGADPLEASAKRRALLEEKIATLQKIGTDEAKKESLQVFKRLKDEQAVLEKTAAARKLQRTEEAASREAAKKKQDEDLESQRNLRQANRRRTLQGAGAAASGIGVDFSATGDVNVIKPLVQYVTQGMAHDLVEGLLRNPSLGNLIESFSISNEIAQEIRNLEGTFAKIRVTSPKLGKGSEAQSQKTSAEARDLLIAAEGQIRKITTLQETPVIGDVIDQKVLDGFTAILEGLKTDIGKDTSVSLFSDAFDKFETSVAGAASDLATPQDTVRVDRDFNSLLDAATALGLDKAAKTKEATNFERDATQFFNNLNIPLPSVLDLINNIQPSPTTSTSSTGASEGGTIINEGGVVHNTTNIHLNGSGDPVQSGASAAHATRMSV